MSALFDEPHIATVTHPDRSRNNSSNAGKLSYQVPPAEEIAVRCMLQMRGGTRAVLDNGAAYPVDAVMYTTDDRIRVDDMVEPQSPDVIKDYKFIVSSVQFKTDVDGEGRHLSCNLTRTQRL